MFLMLFLILLTLPIGPTLAQASVLALSPALSTQPDISISAAISSRRAYIGMPVTVQVAVEQHPGDEAPTFPQVEGATVEYAGRSDSSSSSIVIINGRRREDVRKAAIFSYQVTPTRAGIINIPAITIQIGGKTYSTSPLVIRASEPGDHAKFKLRIEAEKTRVYVGEPIRLRVTWYLQGQAGGGTFTLANDGDAYEFESPPSPRPAGARNDPGYMDFSFLGKPATAVLGQGKLDGKTWETITVDRVLIVKQPGSVRVGPLLLAFNEVVGGSALFPDMEPCVIASNTLSLEVIPLPTPAPAGFTGLIGTYTISAAATPTDVNVGDPIGLSIRLEGSGMMSRVEPIDLTKQPGFARDFLVPAELLVPSIASDGATFTATIRATRDTAANIPAIEMPYFNPQSGQYEIARSAPIPIEVRATREVLLDDVAGAGAGAETTKDEPAEPDAALGGITLATHGVLREEPSSVLALLRAPAWVAGLALPPSVLAVCAAIAGVRGWSARDPAGRRRRGALRRAQRRLRQARAATDQAAAAWHAIAGYLADITGHPEVGLTTRDCQGLLERLGVSRADELCTVLQSCDLARFASRSSASGFAPRAAQSAQADKEPEALTEPSSVIEQAQRLLPLIHAELSEARA